MLKVNKLIMSPSTATAGSSTTVPAGNPQTVPDDLNRLKLLHGTEELYITLKPQNNYPPGEQPTMLDKKLKAMQGEVKKLKKELDKLTQDRGANSASGKSSGKGPIKNIKGDLIGCYNCKGNHYKKNCLTNPGLDNETTQSSSNSSGNNSGQRSGCESTEKSKYAGSGLTHEMNKKTSETIKTKMPTLPYRENIADDAKYSITIDGKVTAKYCCHRGKFVRGKKAHYTAECKLSEDKRFAYQPRAADNMASIPLRTHHHQVLLHPIRPNPVV
jgi:hypothetical protein